MSFYASVAVNVEREREEERGRQIVDVKGGGFYSGRFTLTFNIHILTVSI